MTVPIDSEKPALVARMKVATDAAVLRGERLPMRMVRYAPPVLATALALIVGASALLVANQPTPRPVPSAPGSPASLSPKPSSPGTSSLAVSMTYLDWQVADISTPHTNTTSSVQAVTAFADGYIAVGTEYFKEGRPAQHWNAAIWVSDDGSAWTAVEAPSAFEGGYIVDIAASDARLVAIGNRMTEVRAGPQDPVAAVWVSSDALSWQRVDDAPEFWTIAASPTGFVAATRDGASNASQMWTSRDGVSWEQVATATDLDNGLVRRLRVMDDGMAGLSDVPLVVAVGSKPGITSPGAWVSSADDLSTWRAGDLYETRESGFGLDDVAAGQAGLVAVGYMSCCAMKAVGSQDGLVWQTLHQPTPAEQSTAMTFIAAVPDGFVAFGARDASWEDAGRLTGWTSADGAEWLVIESGVLDAAGDVQFSDAVARPDGALIVVATAPSASGMSPRAWVVRP